MCQCGSYGFGFFLLLLLRGMNSRRYVVEFACGCRKSIKGVINKCPASVKLCIGGRDGLDIG
jgi:hypothetical protein